MASENINRKIAVIFATDVVGYSTSMEANEVQTLKNLKACKKILDDLFLQHGGHVFNTAGDSVLAEFSSAVSAVVCASEFQKLIRERNKSVENFQKKLVDPINKGQLKWNKNSIIIILSILLITTTLALIQVTLPLDLVKGGIYRNALSKEIISLIISIQLILLLFLQWPVGSWISKKGRLYGLKFSLINFSFASFLIFISSYLNNPAFYLISFSLILVSLGTASFLPTSTDIVFRIAPSNKKGFALALLSQCFAMGYFFGPFISGRILDLFGYASVIWLSISFACFIIFAILFKRLF